MTTTTHPNISDSENDEVSGNDAMVVIIIKESSHHHYGCRDKTVPPSTQAKSTR